MICYIHHTFHGLWWLRDAKGCERSLKDVRSLMLSALSHHRAESEADIASADSS